MHSRTWPHTPFHDYVRHLSDLGVKRPKFSIQARRETKTHQDGIIRVALKHLHPRDYNKNCVSGQSLRLICFTQNRIFQLRKNANNFGFVQSPKRGYSGSWKRMGSKVYANQSGTQCNTCGSATNELRQKFCYRLGVSRKIMGILHGTCRLNNCLEGVARGHLKIQF
jgi:hypothetical protein